MPKSSYLLDLLPVTHAAGGREDITYEYDASADYPAHTLLIEATLASATNQRRMEMEPVSRHLGEYLLAHPETQAYCIFATPYLHINVIADFRMRKSAPYYSADGSRSIGGMKIIPLKTSELAAIIGLKLNCAALYRLFEATYASTTSPNLWHSQKIVERL